MPTLPDRGARVAHRERGAVAVIGEALVDRFADGACVAGGAPFNQARWLAALGVPTLFVSRIGAGDAGAGAVRAAARRVDLDERGLQADSRHATGEVQVLMQADGQHRFVIAAEAAWDHLEAAPAAAAVKEAAPEIIVVNTLGQRHAGARAAVGAALAACPAMCFADLNLRPGSETPELAAHVLGQADQVKVNDEELARLLAWFGGETAAALVRRFELERLVVTCGERGWYALDAEGHVVAHGPGMRVDPLVDTVGAGDAFSAVLVAGHRLGLPLQHVGALANRLAAAVCGVRGAMPEDAAFFEPWRRELEDLAAQQATTPARSP